MRKTKLLLLYGGPSNEYEVSIQTAKQIKLELDQSKYDVQEVLIDKNLHWKFENNSNKYEFIEALEYIKSQNYDLAFIAMHGKFGEDGQLQKLLDSIGLKYVGSNAISSEIAMDKMLSNKKYQAAGLSVPKYIVINGKSHEDLTRLDDFPLPFVMKPLKGGSSVGVSIIKSPENIKEGVKLSLKEEDQILAQEYVAGRELTCGVIEKNGELQALIPTEIILTTSKFFDYKAKYTESGCEEITPPENLSKEVIQEIQRQAILAHQALGCKTFSRSDFILKNDILYILETNTIPGMTKFSLLPKGAKALGINFSELLDILIETSLS